MYLIDKAERRASSRPIDPASCPGCQAVATPGLFRTDVVVYFHCAHCACLWSIPKPPVSTPALDK
jgi:Zn ribbon nucleic-acid-binding protein